jgi:hypothetical protein
MFSPAVLNRGAADALVQYPIADANNKVMKRDFFMDVMFNGGLFYLSDAKKRRQNSKNY